MPQLFASVAALPARPSLLHLSVHSVCCSTSRFSSRSAPIPPPSLLSSSRCMAASCIIARRRPGLAFAMLASFSASPCLPRSSRSTATPNLVLQSKSVLSPPLERYSSDFRVSVRTFKFGSCSHSDLSSGLTSMTSSPEMIRISPPAPAEPPCPGTPAFPQAGRAPWVSLCSESRPTLFRPLPSACHSTSQTRI